MNKEKQTITTPRLIEFLGVKYSRFDVWMKENILIFNNPQPGPGNPRQFDFTDVCTAKIATGVMDTTCNFNIAHDVVQMFRRDERQRIWNIMITIIGKKHYSMWVNPNIEFFIPRDNKTDHAVVIIPVPQIMKSVQAFFNGLKLEDEKAILAKKGN